MPDDVNYLTGWSGVQACFFMIVCVLGIIGPSLQAALEAKKTYVTINVEEPDDAAFNPADWGVICRAAIDGAKKGIHRDREWVLKNIIEPAEKEKEEVSYKTSKPIMEDGVATLVSMGHKKGEAETIVSEASREKEYLSVQDLLVDIYKS